MDQHHRRSLQPALFLHFAISFPEERLKDGGRRWLLPILTRQASRLFGLWITAIARWQATGILLHRLTRSTFGYIAAFYVLAATLFSISYSRANTPLLRQQLKWLYRGAWLAVGPFTLLFAIPFLLDVRMPSLLTKAGGPVSGLSPADILLGHHPLPADGYRPDLQARRGLHSRHRYPARRLLRCHRADLRIWSISGCPTPSANGH